MDKRSFLLSLDLASFGVGLIPLVAIYCTSPTWKFAAGIFMMPEIE
jgi:hypothetical protein